VYNVIITIGALLIIWLITKVQWKSCNLTLLGKSSILKCLRIPQLIYSSSMLSVPKGSGVKLIKSQGIVTFLQMLAM